MSDKSGEHSLIKNLRRGDAYSFDEIFKIYNKKVYAFALKNLRNKQDAEGLVQDVFYNLWKDKSRLAEINNLDAWIFKISYNIIRKHFRRLARENQHLQQFSDIQSENENSSATDIEFEDLLLKAEDIIERLPNRQKTVFLLSNREGLSNNEISQKLNITKKTVENHLTKARHFIKRTLVDERLISVLFFWITIR